MKDTTETPDWTTLPAPQDDHGASHLPGAMIASIPLPATDGQVIDLSAISGRVIVYAYPRTGVPSTPNPHGWDSIPGARGCTPQSCAFRDHHNELLSLGVTAVFGLSTQNTKYQTEAATRLHLPFPILSDEKFALTKAMDLPTFSIEGMTLFKRFTIIIKDGRIEHLFYPVFPPDRNAEDVIEWLTKNPL